MSGHSHLTQLCRVYCQTESNFVFTHANDSVPTQCPHSSKHVIDAAQTIVVNPVQELKILGNMNETGRYAEVGLTYANGLRTDIPKSAFGLARITAETPVVQNDFIYGISTQYVDAGASNNGIVPTSSNNIALLNTGTSSNAYVYIHTKRFARYRPGQGMNVYMTGVFNAGVANSQQLLGCGNVTDGLFFGYNGTQFGIMHRSNTVDEWTPQTQWNLDKMDGDGVSRQLLDPTKGNVYRITFQWLGFGAITFMIEDSDTGDFVPVHRIAYANKNVVPSMRNPSFPLTWIAQNLGNTTPITLKAVCCAAFVEGPKNMLGSTFGIDNTKTVSSTTVLANVLTIYNRPTYQSIAHYIPLFVRMLSVGTDGTKNCVVYLVKNATIGGTPSFIDISSVNSVSQYDTTGTSVTGGIQIAAFTFAKVESRTQSLGELDIFLEPGDKLTIAAKLTGTGSTEVSASVTWLEDR